MVSGALVILFTFLTGNEKKIRKRWKDIVRTLPAEPSVSRAFAEACLKDVCLSFPHDLQGTEDTEFYSWSHVHLDTMGVLLVDSIYV